MLNIKDTNKLGKVISEALAKVELTVKDASNKKRWINAIAKAAAQIELHGEFMTYDETENHLVIWSQDSNEIYSANGVCQCQAFEKGFACWHRAAARIVRLSGTKGNERNSLSAKHTRSRQRRKIRIGQIAGLCLKARGLDGCTRLSLSFIQSIKNQKDGNNEKYNRTT